MWATHIFNYDVHFRRPFNEIINEINLLLLKSEDISIPFKLTCDDIEKRFLKKFRADCDKKFMGQ